jgi:peptidoglycan/xylan/chitin deacetylase (PgdA/CDA1 family)
MHRGKGRTLMTESQIAVLGNVEDVRAALDVFRSVQRELAVSRLLVITRDPPAMQTAVQSLRSDLEIVVNLDMFDFDSISSLCLFLNLFPAPVPSLFDAAVRAIPVVWAASAYVPPVFVSQESGYQFPYQDMNALKEVLLRIAAAPERAREFAREAQQRTIAWCGRSYLSHEQNAAQINSRISPLRSFAKRVLFASAPRRGLVLKGDSRRPQFSLTFDDGPSPASTRAILATLRQFDVRSTFFLVGNRAAQYPELVKAILDDGHEIGSHSHTHPYFHRLSLSQAAREIAVSQSVLEAITGQACCLFRPPFGNLSIQSLLQPWFHRQSVVMWTVDLKDYKASNVAAIEKETLDHHFVNGDIILYHGLNAISVEALPVVIEAAKSGARKGVTISRLEAQPS